MLTLYVQSGIKEMTDKFVDVPLFSEPYYSYSLSLEGNSYILEFSYVERSKLYYLSLYTAEKELIVAGVAVVPKHSILLDYSIPGLSGTFWMEEVGNSLSEPYKQFPEKINQYYKMFYVYPDEV